MDPFTIASLIAGGTSLFGGLLNSGTQKSINKANIEMQRETNALQEKMFNQSLDWQRESQQIQNDYNSLESQVNQALRAGLNPAMIAEGNGSHSASGASGVAVPHMVAPHAEMVQNPAAQAIQNVSLIARSMADISQSGLSNAQKESYLLMMEEQYNALVLDNEGKRIQNNLNWKFGDQMKQAEYDLMVKQAAAKVSEIELNGALSQEAKEKAFEAVSNALLSDAKRKLTNKEYKFFEQKWSAEKAEIQSRIAVNKSAENKNYAEAEKARWEGAFAESKTVWQELDNKVHANDVVISNKTLNAEINKAVESAKTSKAITEQTRKNIELLQEQLEHWKDINNTWMYQKTFDNLMELIRTATGVNEAVNKSVNTGIKAAAAASFGL